MACLLILFALVMVRPASCWGQGRTLASYQLALQWPKAYCTTHACKNPIPPVFTIHGVFGMDNQDRPLSCRQKARRNMTNAEQLSLTPFINLLGLHWPNLENGPNMGFWDYEFSKYASCFNIPPVDYFAKALFLKIQLDNDMKTNAISRGNDPDIKVLASADPTRAVLHLNGVVPTATIFFHASQFAGAFRTFLGATVQIKCNNDTQHQNQLLEIYICVDHNWKLMMCNTVKYIDCATTANSAPTEIIGINSTSTTQLP